jgi:glucose/arabinose dehydrogenase
VTSRIARPGRVATVAVVAVAGLLAVAACGTSDDPEPAEGGAPAHTESITGSTGGPDTTAVGSLEDVAIELTPIAEVRSPVAMAPRPTTNDLFVAEQGGRVRRITIDRSEVEPSFDLHEDPVLDISDETTARGEQGLLGIAFSPDGDRMYLDYTDQGGDTHIVEYRMSGDAVDGDSRRELLRVDQPFPNHNGGQLAFGPDGFLYVAMGDGGGSGDPDERGQDTGDLLGKILRIDPSQPSGGRAYGIPAGNPFATGGGAAEIWLYGVRNPWRFSFDRATDDLWVADVGQNEIEEITWLPAATEGAGRGANLGWNLREGTDAFGDNEPVPGLIDPIFDYPNGGDNCSVTGGYVYRGRAIPALTGVYLFGDYCASEIRGLLVRDGAVVDERNLGVSVAERSLSSFGQDLEGEVYVLSTDGTVYRIEPA